ncbi:chemotaxis protein histidine kinase-like protein [Acidovorax sp. CF316]|uniref:ATP-binding protein n=1 Tax=Acidovorax sp. CF316 TaxID=1144317 RepID=UPI00026BBE6B|nr:ATP-binding protein [Acidovorax sp. CF316]EJE54397.1 chemotaxis protein histidine kinase-like protein [Acidovorax sp. CF316]
MTVRLRITLLIVLTFLALCAIGGYALYQSSRSAQQVKAVTEGVVPSTIQSVEMMGQLKDVHIATMAMVSAPDEESAKTTYEALSSRKSELKQALASQMRQADSDAQRGLIKEAEMSLENYFQAIDDTAKFKLAGQQEAAEATMAATVDQYLREQGQMIEAVQVEKRRGKDQAIASLNANLTQTTTTLSAITVLAVLAMGGIGLLLYRQIVRPIGEMERKMTEIATSQDFSHRVPVARMDEIGRSLTAFNLMVEKIQESTELVRRKTADIQVMLHTIPQGILTLQAGGVVHPEYSDHLASIVETREIAGRSVGDVLLNHTDLGADALAQATTAIDACIGEDEMNFEFNAHLLPGEVSARFAGGESKVLDLTWSPIASADGSIERLMLCVRDVTELRELARAAQAQKQELAMIGEVLAVQQEKFHDFVDSSASFVLHNQRLLDDATADATARAGAVAELFRNMHTIKGNARTYGLLQLADVAHAAEQRYDALRQELSGWDGAALGAELQAVRASLETYAHINDTKLGRKGPGRRGSVEKYLMVPRERIDELLHAAGSALHDSSDLHATRALLEQVQHALQLLGTHTLHDVLETVVASLPDLAQELGKEAPRVVITDGGVALRAQVTDVLRNTFMHLLRNALDHGIEAAQERAAHGKPSQGRIEIALRQAAGQITLRLSDDGRGLNLDRIRAKAIASGLVPEDCALAPAETAQLIFAPGFSTASEVTAISGRGVGMDAVKAFIESVGGSIGLELLPGGASAGHAPFQTVIHLPAQYGVARRAPAERAEKEAQ